MTDLFEKSMITLELPRVLEQLSACAATQEGKEKALQLRPMTDLDDVQRAQEETSAAVKMLVLRGNPGLSGVKPVGAILHRADMGGSLNTRELLEVAAVLRCARTAKEYGDSEEKTPISHLFHALTPNRFLEDTITNSIVGEDELADSASSELASIRRHMRATEAKVRDILQKLISSNQSKYLQESIITIRSDRYVVPVKSEHKNAIPGLVHDVSASGSTFFIEPMGVVKANNELRELLAKEKKEIERILAELSAQCAAHKEDILEDYQLLDVAVDRLLQKRLYLRRVRTAQKRQNDRAAIGMQRDKIHAGGIGKGCLKNAAELQRLCPHDLLLYEKNAAFSGDMGRRYTIGHSAEPHRQQQCGQQDRRRCQHCRQCPQQPMGQHRQKVPYQTDQHRRHDRCCNLQRILCMFIRSILLHGFLLQT